MDTRKLVLHKGSHSAHCCFSASALVEGEKDGNSIFEAFEEKDAVEIIKRWNAYHDDQGLEVHRLLMISTAHITKEVDEAWHELMGEDSAREVASGAFLEQTTYGWMLLIEDPDDDWVGGADGSPQADAVVAFARAHNCTHLRIDRDGPTVPGLPTYNW